MTEQEIDKLARAFAHFRAFDGGHFTNEEELTEDFKAFLGWLLESHCIVSHEVIKDYREAITELYLEGRTPTFDGLTIMFEDMFDNDILKKLFNEE